MSRCSRSDSIASVPRYSLPLLLVLDHAADEQIEVEAERRERGAQFVRDRRDEADAALGQVDEAPAREADRRDRDDRRDPRQTKPEPQRGPPGRRRFRFRAGVELTGRAVMARSGETPCGVLHRDEPSVGEQVPRRRSSTPLRAWASRATTPW